jgi:uncharacterized membrane protein YedE/YeeE
MSWFWRLLGFVLGGVAVFWLLLFAGARRSRVVNNASPTDSVKRPEEGSIDEG